MSTDALFLNPEQVAERLQVSEYTALKWQRGTLVNLLAEAEDER